MGWWRNFVRSRTKRILPTEKAMKTNRMLSTIYFFTAWNALALGIYWLFTENFPRKDDEINRSGKYYARLMGTGDAKAIRIKGFQIVDEYQIEGTARPEKGRTWIERQREERERKERERDEGKDRQDLNLLVEETNSL